MKQFVLAFAGVLASGVHAVTHTGLNTYADIEALRAAATGGVYTLGLGTLRYDGVTGTWSDALALVPTGATGAATVDVSDEGANLTVSGPLSETGGLFAKKGPGTVTFAYPGAQALSFDNGAVSYKDDNQSPFLWDEGVLTNAPYRAAFNVTEGKVVFSGAGQVTTVNGESLVGSRADQKAVLEVRDGAVFDQSTKLFNMGASTAGTEFNVLNGALARIGSFWSFRGLNKKSCVRVDNAKLECLGNFTHGGAWGPSAESRVVVTNGGVLEVVAAAGSQRMLQVCNYMESSSYLDVADGGSVYARDYYVGARGHLSVQNGGRFLVSVTDPQKYSTGQLGGANNLIFFDGGILSPYTNSNIEADWFTGHQNPIQVGSKGLIVSNDSFAVFSGRVAPADGTTAAKIVKKGSGELVLAAQDGAVEVKEGTVSFYSPKRTEQCAAAGSLTFSAGARLGAVAGSRALGGMTFAADGQTTQFRPQGCETNDTGWTSVSANSSHSTLPRLDAWSIGVPGGGGAPHALWRNEKLDVTKDFRVDFDYHSYNVGNGCYGIGCMWQNCNQGLAAVGQCYAYSNFCGTVGGTLTENCLGLAFATRVGVNELKRGINLHRNGSFEMSGEVPFKYLEIADQYGTRAHPIACSVSYEAAAHRLTATFGAWGQVPQIAVFENVNLAEIVGGGTCYFGFTGENNYNNGQQIVRNVRFGDEPVRTVETGGNATLSAGAVWTAALGTSETTAHYVADSMTYGDGAELCLSNDLAQSSNHLDLPRGDDVSAWQVTNYDYAVESKRPVYTGEGWWTLTPEVISSIGNPRTTLGTRTGYVLAGDWDMDFTYDIGTHGVTPRGEVTLQFSQFYGKLTWGASYDLGLRYEFNETGSVSALHIGWSGAWPLDVTGIADISPVKYGPIDFRLSYRQSKRQLAVRLSQQNGARVYEVSTPVGDEGPDMLKLMGESYKGKAYVLFQSRDGAAVASTWCENRIGNIRFRSGAELAGVEKPSLGFASLTGTGTLVKTGDADLALAGEGAGAARVRVAEGGLRVLGSSARLGTLVASAGAPVTAVSDAADATLTVGTLAGAAQTLVRPTTNVTLAVENVTGVETLTVSGGVFACANDAALPETTVLALDGGAKLNLPFSGTLRVKSLMRDGVKLRGVHTAETDPDLITGPGAVTGSHGLILIVR